MWSSFQQVRGENIFVDSDGDGLSNEEERLYKTDPENIDTDGDSYSDGVEVTSGYDPLKPAPGDKLFASAGGSDQSMSAQNPNGDNLTEGLSQQIASVINQKSANGEEVTLEELDVKVNELLSGKGTEVVLPPVDVKGLKVKNPISDDLSENERKEKEREQATKYLTAMAYIFANNTPQQFSTESELGNTLTALSGQVLSSLSGNNKEIITTLANNGRETIRQAKDVEVPDHMLPLHIKALQLAQYAISLEEEIKNSTGDPLAQISDMVKIQSLVSASIGYVIEVEEAMKKYEVGELPVQL